MRVMQQKQSTKTTQINICYAEIQTTEKDEERRELISTSTDQGGVAEQDIIH